MCKGRDDALSKSQSIPADNMSNFSESSSEFNHRIHQQRNFPFFKSFLTQEIASKSQNTLQYTADDMKLNYKMPSGFTGNTMGTPVLQKKNGKEKKNKWF